MKIFQDFFNSRKAQAFLVLTVVVFLGAKAGLEHEQVELTAQCLMAYILCRAIHDNGLAK